MLEEVYLDGWRTHNPAEDGNWNGWCSDDIAAVFELPGYYRYVRITAWSGAPLNEPEVDAVAGLSMREVAVDIKPGSCPNPLNTKSKGVLPVAVLGTASFDITLIDPDTVSLEGVSPLQWALADVGTPFGAPLEDCLNCIEECGDGDMDLVLDFDTQEVVDALGEVEDGDCIVLEINANLKEEHNGTLIIGEDVVWILKKGRQR